MHVLRFQAKYMHEKNGFEFFFNYLANDLIMF